MILNGSPLLKDSPREWQTLPLKRVADVVLGKMLTNEDKGGYSEKPYLRAQNIQWEKVDADDIRTMWFSQQELLQYRLVKNDLLVSEGGEVGRTAIWKDEIPECYIQNSVHRVRVSDEVEPRFLLYSFIALGKRGHFDAIVNRISIGHLTKEKLISVKFSFPPLLKQRSIVRFLNEKTAKIDTLIKKKRRLIELLKEERQAIINHAVTRGLDSNAKLKPSGIEWLGDMPEGWGVKRLKWIIDMQGGFAFQSSEFVEEGIQLLKIGNLYQNELQLDRQPTYLPKDFASIYPSFLVGNGDILMSLTGTLGKRDYGYAVLLNSDEVFLLNQRVAKLSVKENFCKLFFFYVLQSESYLSRLFSLPTGTKQGNFSEEEVLSIAVGVPQREEQEFIVNYLDSKTNEINSLISKAERAIELLTEYRATLITEAVTGRIQVLGAVTKAKAKSKFFPRFILHTEIVHKLHNEPTFGRVKAVKLGFLAERLFGDDSLTGEYYRQAAGPLDRRFITQFEKKIEQNRWFKAAIDDHRILYAPLEHAGEHQKYLEKAFRTKADDISKFIKTFRKASSLQCEIVATLFAAWNDFLLEGKQASDDQIIVEVRTNWHIKKQRIPEEKWRKALQWMKSKGYVPQGTGNHTIIRESQRRKNIQLMQSR
jgi:type I restriction enzyme S subunit